MPEDYKTIVDRLLAETAPTPAPPVQHAPFLASAGQAFQSSLRSGAQSLMAAPALVEAGLRGALGIDQPPRGETGTPLGSYLELQRRNEAAAAARQSYDPDPSALGLLKEGGEAVAGSLPYLVAPQMAARQTAMQLALRPMSTAARQSALVMPQAKAAGIQSFTQAGQEDPSPAGLASALATGLIEAGGTRLGGRRGVERMAGGMPSPTAIGPAALRVTSDVLEETGEEAGTEMLQTAVDDMIRRGKFDPNAITRSGLVAGLAGGSTALGMTGPAEAIGLATQGRAEDQALQEALARASEQAALEAGLPAQLQEQPTLQGLQAQQFAPYAETPTETLPIIPEEAGPGPVEVTPADLMAYQAAEQEGQLAPEPTPEEAAALRQGVEPDVTNPQEFAEAAFPSPQERAANEAALEAETRANLAQEQETALQRAILGQEIDQEAADQGKAPPAPPAAVPQAVPEGVPAAVPSAKDTHQALQVARQAIQTDHQAAIEAINAARVAGTIGKPQAATLRGQLDAELTRRYAEAFQAVGDGKPMPQQPPMATVIGLPAPAQPKGKPSAQGTRGGPVPVSRQEGAQGQAPEGLHLRQQADAGASEAEARPVANEPPEIAAARQRVTDFEAGRQSANAPVTTSTTPTQPTQAAPESAPGFDRTKNNRAGQEPSGARPEGVTTPEHAELAKAMGETIGTVEERTTTSKPFFGTDPKQQTEGTKPMAFRKRTGHAPWVDEAIRNGANSKELLRVLEALEQGKPLPNTKAARWVMENRARIEQEARDQRAIDDERGANLPELTPEEMEARDVAAINAEMPFRLQGGEPFTGTEVADLAANFPKGTTVTKEADKITFSTPGGAKIRVELVQGINAKGEKAAASAAIIRENGVAIGRVQLAKGETSQGTAPHEFLHIAIAMGLVTPAEQATLLKAANDLFARNPRMAEGGETLQDLQKRYEALYAGQKNAKTTVDEEKMAVAREYWKTHPSESPAVNRTVWQKIKDFFTNTLASMGVGQKTISAVLKSLDEGTVFERSPKPKVEESIETEEKLSIPPKKVEADENAAPATMPQVESEAFRNWFKDSKVVDDQGKPLVVYHGTGRPDRVGSRFRKARATSGPMQYFTDDPAIGSKYAEGKQDTSAALEDRPYESWFKVKPAGSRSEVNIDQLWWRLSPEERAKVTEMAPRVSRNDDNEIILEAEDHKRGLGGYDQNLKEARGNHLKALVEEWLSSGALFGDEIEFQKVLRMVGIDTARMDDPHATAPSVFPAYLSIQNPLVTNAMPDGVMDSLDKASRLTRAQPAKFGADPWDKRLRTPLEWMKSLKEDQAKGINSFVWSSVPDWVTETLKKQGYDGIHDTGGKMGGDIHDVWVPFEENQIKSAIGNRGTFSPESKDIRYSLQPSQVARIKPQVQGTPITVTTGNTSHGLLLPPDKPVPMGSIQRLIRKNLTHGGDLPVDVAERALVTNHLINGLTKEIAFIQDDYNKAMKGAFKKPTVADRELVNAVLAGEQPASAITHKPLADVLERMRGLIDGMTHEGIRIGLFQGPILAAVQANMGTYLNRTYRVHSDPKWAEKVPPQVRNRAFSFVKAQAPNLSDAEIDGILNEILAPDLKSPVPRGQTLGSKKLDFLLERTRIPKPLRDLMGEYKDPLVNFANSYGKMAAAVENHKFLTDILSNGKGVYFFDKPTVKDGVSFNQQIAVEDSKAMAPLNGIYTTQEIAQAFKDHYGKSFFDKDGVGGFIVKSYAILNGYTKYAKTVGNFPTGHIRNFVSNSLIAVANGHYTSASAIFQGLSGNVKDLKAKMGFGNEQAREFHRRMIELGIVGQDVAASELNAVIEDAGIRSLDEFSDSLLKRTLAKGKNFLAGSYELADSVWKINAFYHERAALAKGRPNLSETELDSQAAERVRDTYPTYEKLPKIIKDLRRVPFIGGFMGFQTEMIRCTKNTVKLGIKDMQTPGMRLTGAKRLVGTLVAMSIPPILAAAFRGLHNIDDDDEESARRLAVAPWSQYSTLLWLGKNEQGQLRYADISWTDPWGFARKSINAALAGDFTSAASNLITPYVGPSMVTTALSEVWTNSKTGGGRVYNEGDTKSEMIKKIADHLYKKVLEPGTASSAGRIYKAITDYTEPSGRTYSVEDEIISMAFGLRMSAVDPAQALKYKSYGISDRYRAASTNYNATVKRVGATEEEKAEALKRRDELRDEISTDAAQLYRDALILGLDHQAAEEALKAGKVPKYGKKAIQAMVTE